MVFVPQSNPNIYIYIYNHLIKDVTPQIGGWILIFKIRIYHFTPLPPPTFEILTEVVRAARRSR
jgi:hypothetical protein